MSTMSRLVILMQLVGAIVAQDKVCAQCATPILSDKWSATGLPKKPDGLKFDKDCAVPTDAQLDTKDWQSGTCGSSCFELVIPVDGVYQYVRGCHENFVWDEFKVTVNNGSAKICQLNPVPEMGSIGFLTLQTTVTAYEGTSFCQPPVPTGTDPFKACNNELKDTSMTSTGVTGCTAGSSQTCKSCEENDGSGSCTASTSGTCKGVYCTKTSGKINGHFYESRGCASFNPFAASVCSWADQTLNISTGVNADVGLSFRANQCFCQGELCNSSPRLHTLLLSTISLTFLLFS